MQTKIKHRPRRLRKSTNVRDLVAETDLSVNDLIWPVFILEDSGIKTEEIKSMPGCLRLSLESLYRELDQLSPLGLKGLALFPCIKDSLKSSDCREAYNPKGLAPKSISEIKKRYPELVLFSDVALDPYSTDGHDGLVKDGEILNDESVVVLAKQALCHAEAGADFVAPSDMMDGRVGELRYQMDKQGFEKVGILSYAAKYASGFYGPFRDALDSAPRQGDKKTYQMDYRNQSEALIEARLDLQEGADILMVKPALSYLDVIYRVKKHTGRPVAAYNVSGEYAMIKAAAKNGWLDEKSCVLEKLHSIKRAGADIIFSYHTPDVLKWK